jgi:hypothetical protein
LLGKLRSPWPPFPFSIFTVSRSLLLPRPRLRRPLPPPSRPAFCFLPSPPPASCGSRRPASSYPRLSAPARVGCYSVPPRVAAFSPPCFVRLRPASRLLVLGVRFFLVAGFSLRSICRLLPSSCRVGAPVGDWVYSVAPGLAVPSLPCFRCVIAGIRVVLFCVWFLSLFAFSSSSLRLLLLSVCVRQHAERSPNLSLCLQVQRERVHTAEHVAMSTIYLFGFLVCTPDDFGPLFASWSPAMMTNFSLVTV